MNPVALPSQSAARIATSGTVIAFDFGAKRIGVAVGDLSFRQASSLGAIASEQRSRRFEAIARLIDEWRPVRLVVGLPRHEDGRPHAMGKRCERFASQLRGRFGIAVDLVDERLSSWEAERVLQERGHHVSREAIDAEAARIILQSYFDEAAGR